MRADNYLGKSNFGYALYAGSLDEAAIYAAPLSAARIQAHYAQQVYGTANIDLLQNGHVVRNIATGIPDSGHYTGIIPINAALGGGYQIQVTVNYGAQPDGVSGQPFLITNSGHDYYVAANGDDANSGKDPSQPMASVSALLVAYPGVGSGDTIHVGPGSYTLLKTMVLDASHSGITITGPTSGPPAVINRDNPTLDVIDVEGASNVTIEYLSITGGASGILATDNSGSNSLTIANCSIYANSSNGVYIGLGDTAPQIINNTLYGLPHNSNNNDNQPNGINFNYGYANDALISGNVVHDSSNTGITVNYYDFRATVTNNIVYACGTGIYVAN